MAQKLAPEAFAFRDTPYEFETTRPAFDSTPRLRRARQAILDGAALKTWSPWFAGRGEPPGRGHETEPGSRVARQERALRRAFGQRGFERVGALGMLAVSTS